MNHKKIICQISGKEVGRNEAVRCSGLSASLLKELKHKIPALDEQGFISFNELHKLRAEHIKKIFESDHGALSHLEKEVLDKIVKNELLSENPESKPGEKLTYGERL